MCGIYNQIRVYPAELQVKVRRGFGEGFAMLAAAGSPNVHLHTVSNMDEGARWDKDMANFNDDLKKVEAFFIDVLDNRLTEDQISKTHFSFFGIQGPWSRSAGTCQY